MVTIKEVATRAGVSVGTVSNVINDLSTVSARNRKKVNEIILELGYTPNKIAASLSNKKTKNIGLVVTDISSPFYSDLIKAITETLETYGYHVFLCGSDENIAKEEKLIKNLMSMWVDGIILIPSYADCRDIHFLNSLEIPLVVVNREIEGFEKDIVVFDNFKGAYEGVQYLIKAGCRKIAMLTGSNRSQSSIDRYMGWKKAMEENDLYEEGLAFWGHYTIESGAAMAEDAFKKNKGLDCFFTTSDLIALGAMRVVKSKGLKIPDDISVMGFGDISLSQFLTPSLATVKRPFQEIGKLSALIMIERLNYKGDFSQKKIIVDGETVIRDSVKKL